MRLSKILKKKPFCNNAIYFFIAIILLILSLKYPLFYILLALYLIIVVLKTKIIIPVILFILLFFSRIMVNKLITFEEKNKYNVYISDVINDNSYEGYIGINKVLLYENNHDKKPGERYEVSIKFNKIEEKSYDTDFDYEYYYKSKGITKTGKVTNSKYLSTDFSINSIKYHYLNYLKENLSEDTYLYVRALVFGDNNLEDDVKDSYSILGLSHILAISGMHIVFLFSIISFILLKVFNYYKKLIPLVIVSLFVVVIGMPTSSVRALLFLIIGSLNKGRIRYSRLDILSISGIIMLAFNPYLLYSTGFILSFFVSYILIIKDDVFKKSGSSLIDSYKLYILIFLVTLPFVININNKISIFSILLSPILSLVLGYVILPISYILALVPILDIVFKYVFIFLNMYIVNLGSMLPTFHYESFNIYRILVYYLIFVVFIYGLYKGSGIYYFSMLFSYLLMIYGIRYVDGSGKVTFIDVNQGDSALIELPYSKGIMVIDCYNSFRYLKSRGIDYIDYLVLTHSDDDHIKDYKDILDEFRVGVIYYSKYDSRFDELLAGIDNKKPINDIDKLNNDVFNIKVLGPIYSYDDYNSNSIVLKLTIYNTSFLFTGDMTLKEEDDIMNKYSKYLNSDILKVPHHGSDTSSGLGFLNLVSPSESIISVGKNNNYGLPVREIVKRLENMSKVYMTKDSGNINVFVNKEGYYIKTYR